MGQKMTWEEMKKAFPDEWLLIVDYALDEYQRLASGVVLRHSRFKDEVYVLPAVDQDAAFRYTGESTFAGLRSHAQYSHAF